MLTWIRSELASGSRGGPVPGAALSSPVVCPSAPKSSPPATMVTRCFAPPGRADATDSASNSSGAEGARFRSFSTLSIAVNGVGRTMCAARGAVVAAGTMLGRGAEQRGVDVPAFMQGLDAVIVTAANEQ